jgi:hypothetical protein
VSEEALDMFGFHSETHPKWKRVEEDFVPGVCSRVPFGFITRAADGWAAFDQDAGPLGSFADLPVAQDALWRAHLRAQAHGSGRQRSATPGRWRRSTAAEFPASR